jgi:prolyl-tRNA editing enzyme YbaK/EbsC (Cys-tRNA(Pro) deacylase)
MEGSPEENRLSRLERLAEDIQANCDLEALSNPAKRVVAAAKDHRLLGCALFRVPASYYSLPLSERATKLASAPAQLCKTVVFSFSNAPEGCAWRYFAVIVQYLARLDMERITKYVKAAAGASGDVSIKMADDGEAVSGFSFNSVSPLGLATAMPLIVAKPICKLPYIWLGGGEPDLKLRLFTSQLQRLGSTKLPVVVVDCSIARDEEADGPP